MRLGGRFLLVLACALVLAPAALGARPTLTEGACAFDGSLASEHFVVHFTTNETDCAAEVLYEPQAGDVLAGAEQAYKAIVEDWGFPAPVDDGDGKTDIYVYELKDADDTPLAFILDNDAPGSPQTGWFALNPDDAVKPEVVGASFFHVVALNYSTVFQEWFLFGSAEWAGLRAAGFPDYDSSLTAPEITLDCYEAPCATDLFHDNGQARWPFYAYVIDRFGDAAMRELWEALAARSPTGVEGIGALEDFLGSKGVAFEDFFNDYAGAVAAGAIKATSLANEPPAVVATIQTGQAAVTLAPVKTGVNHLAARFVALKPGSGSNAKVCHPATLTVTVDIPSGVSAQPRFFFRGTLTPFSVSGSKATLTTAWDTCTWTDDRTAYVSLPNPELSLNGKDFKVTAAISAIDTSTILSPNAPAAVADPRTAIATAPAVSPPPALTVYGPASLKLPKSRRLFLHVFASNAGRVRFELDGRELRTLAVRAGQNVFRLVLPKPKAAKKTGLSKRSRTASLTLTAVSKSGQDGATITQRLVYRR